ncbi:MULTISPECIES: LysE family translocator [Ureibacillus]|jgi:threonine/homoserine/homoserine lactone efflux protein|uniref:Threonine/homoserine/homoserine lactone efflux protein n=1 Tax=Ureibacillus thermosphaericus TaxID=51173 RepID=A0A840PJ94_URETH|nr:LysE family transporter [Ureibacillus thermosphaericus]MBB5148475.1 threonine/homoserine/homoserine lactone efflux protein [Ureibacillus thermosphaericus]NKZ31199.1 LysE family transporter [Ureibacillus thermosphaericus]
MALYLTYVIVGLSIAMPIGAISVEMIKQGLKNGFWHGWAVGLGGMTIDLALIAAFYFGLSSILKQPFIQIPMWIVGAVFLFLIGYDSIKNADHDITLSGEKPTKSWFSSYRNGFLVAISPGNIVFWLSVFGSVLTNSYDMANPIKFITIGTGVLTGILLHDIGLLTIVSTTRKLMSRSMIKVSSIIAGIVLIGFSGYFVYEAISAVKQLI